MRQETAIAGVGATPYYFRGQSAPQTLYELICKAILAAVDDAGLNIEDVDGLAFYAAGFDPALISESHRRRRYTGLVEGYKRAGAGIQDRCALKAADAVTPSS